MSILKGTKQAARNKKPLESKDDRNWHNKENEFKDFNISDLVTDLTVETNMKSYSPFEPSEITGRSTLRVPVTSEIKKNVALTLEEILGSSCCDEVRGMRDSLVKTADISNISQKSFWNLSNLSNNISIIPLANDDNNKFLGEFRSDNSIASLLNAEELEWENEKASLPHYKEISIITNNSGASSVAIEKRSTNVDDQLSVSNFFQKMSDENIDVLFVQSPKKKRKPEPLVDISSSKCQTAC